MMTSMVLWLEGVNGFVAKGREWPCAGDQLLAGGLLVLKSLPAAHCVRSLCLQSALSSRGTTSL
jgi:hypothetical protein